jgi:hypothetical protein
MFAIVFEAAFCAGGGFTIRGTSCPGYTVEVFSSPTGDGEGQVFLGTTIANPGGGFSLPGISPPYSYLTATATSAADGTSEFSPVFTSPLSCLFLPYIIE